MIFQDLEVWKRSKNLAVSIYKTIKKSALEKDYSFRDQIQRCSISIPSNIAEGYSRDSDKDRVHFLYIAKGSAAELWTQTKIACEAGLLDKNQANMILDEVDQIQRMLAGFIKAIRS